MPVPILDKNAFHLGDSESNAQYLALQVMKRNTVESQFCPWVKIKGLYTSLTITGPTSWVPLFKKIGENKPKKVILYTGRHGDVCNYLDQNGYPAELIDLELYKEDKKRLHDYKSELKHAGIEHVELVDVDKWKQHQSKHLKHDIEKQLSHNHVCVIGWCYSIYTFCEEPYQQIDKDFLEGVALVGKNPSGEPRKPSKWDDEYKGDKDKFIKAETAYKKAHQALKDRIVRQTSEIKKYANKPIKEITAKYFDWVK